MLNAHISQTVKYFGTLSYVECDLPQKVRAILEAPRASNLEEIQTFEGYCTDYSRFVPNFRPAFAPLYALLKKNVKFVRKQDHQSCFEIMKNLFIGNNISTLFNPNLETAVSTAQATDAWLRSRAENTMRLSCQLISIQKRSLRLKKVKTRCTKWHVR